MFYTLRVTKAGMDASDDLWPSRVASREVMESTTHDGEEYDEGDNEESGGDEVDSVGGEDCYDQVYLGVDVAAEEERAKVDAGGVKILHGSGDSKLRRA